MSVRSTVLALCLALALPAIGFGQSVPTPLYRVFLADGSVLASFGEWTRVGDAVVFSMPLTPGASAAELHLVSLPVQRVDLERSERYAEAVRSAQYASTRGEADFAQLSSSVAQTLNQVSLIADPKQRLATAEQARRTLATWPGAHYGYRAAEVRDILGILDDVISGLRAQAGQGGFDLTLAATTDAPPPEALLPPPDHTEVIKGLIAASDVAESPAERISLLQSVVGLIERAVDYLPASFASAIRGTALGNIAAEQRTDAAYAQLRTATLGDATRFAERADVRSLELLRDRVRTTDAKLGARRPADVAGMLATVEAHLDSARRLRLAQDQWLLAESRMLDYRRAVSPYVQALAAKRASFDDIKLQAGPAPQRLLPLARELDRHARFLALIDPPPSLIAVHAAFRSAYSLALNAVTLRHDAVQAADLELAQRASSAAAGALLLLERARTDLRAALEPPVKPARP
jgi:hypothetical protein